MILAALRGQDNTPNDLGVPMVFWRSNNEPFRFPILSKQAAILVTWLLPVALQALGWFVLLNPPDPHYTLRIRERNFVRGIVGIPASISFSLGWTEPNGLETHAIMAGIVWPILLAVVSLTPLNRLPIRAHIVLSILWTIGGCCLFMAL